MEDWVELNRTNWDERAAPHAASPDYAVQRFVDDPAFLSDVVRFDLPRLPDVRGRRGVHLQCHIGTDTLSLARLGATMSGLDFSGEAIAQARALAERTGTPIEYVQATVDDATTVLEPGAFDFVFTGIGALCWLPDVAAWARTVAALLRPGGELFIREGHPMLWTLDENRMDALAVRYPYFETPEPIVFDEPGTYVESEHVFVHTRSASWAHGLGETVTALLAAGLRLTLLEEHRTVPWEALPGRMVRTDFDEWRLEEGGDLVPLTFTLRAVKDA
jgi:SAM-dependent methyltransferase